MRLRLPFRKLFLARAQEMTDETGLHRFLRAMSRKLAKTRAKGRAGWQDLNAVTDDVLAKQLVDCVAKGDPVDIANYCMFLHQRDPNIAQVVIRQALVNHVVTEIVPHIRKLTSANKG